MLEGEEGLIIIGGVVLITSWRRGILRYSIQDIIVTEIRIAS